MEGEGEKPLPELGEQPEKKSLYENRERCNGGKPEKWMAWDGFFWMFFSRIWDVVLFLMEKKHVYFSRGTRS